MLRKRSRGTSEQALMADFNSSSSPTEICRNPISSIFGSPMLFTTIASKALIDSESLQSPTSILDSKPFSILKKPFWSDSKSPNPNFSKLDSRKVGLGIVEEESDPKESKPVTRMVVFGSQLKIQIPPLPQSSVLSPANSPKSPPDFGIKTRKSFGSGNSGLESSVSPRVFISASDMELSEEYTCVITHGPNPKTTHIFDDCIVESCCGVVGVCGEKRENMNGSLRYPSESFLSFCYTCKKSLGQGKDIYMYRGEKAFCSSECRYKEMVLDEGMTDDAFGDSFKGF